METPETIVRRLIEEGFNEGTLAVADELISPDMIEHQNFGPDHAPGAEGVKAVIASLRRAFPDFHLAIDDCGRRRRHRLAPHDRHRHEPRSFMGHAPTGRPMRTDVFDTLRVHDGRVVEHWGVPDRLSTLFQLGLAAPPARSSAAAPAPV